MSGSSWARRFGPAGEAIEGGINAQDVSATLPMERSYEEDKYMTLAHPQRLTVLSAMIDGKWMNVQMFACSRSMSAGMASAPSTGANVLLAGRG